MIAVSVFVTAVATPLTGPILRAIDTTPGQYDYAFQYLVILFSGIATIGFYNVFAGVLRGVGSSMYPLIVFLCSVVLNALYSP